MKINEIPVTIYPELIGPAIANKEDDLLAVYFILKSVDEHFNNNTGLIEWSTLLKVFYEVLGVKKAQVYKRVEAGVGIYWHKPGGKTAKGKRVGLKSPNYVWDHLKPTMFRTKPFAIPMSEFRNNTEHTNRTYIKRLLISIVAARHSDFRPQSAESISKEARVSKKTVQRAVGMSHVVKQYNFQKLYESNNIFDAISAKNFFKVNDGRFCWVFRGETPSVLCQIGNSYSVPWHRLPLKKRPAKAKDYDMINKPLESPAMVYAGVGGNKKQTAKSLVTPVGYLNLPKLSKVKLWSGAEAQVELEYQPQDKFRSVSEMYDKVFSTV